MYAKGPADQNRHKSELLAILMNESVIRNGELINTESLLILLLLGDHSKDLVSAQK